MRSSPLVMTKQCLTLAPTPNERGSQHTQPNARPNVSTNAGCQSPPPDVTAANVTVPDIIVASDMLDLPAWLGFVARDRSRFAAGLLRAPIVTYFHESQWDYPIGPSARVDFHYGYTNLLTACASDACWFNSQFHLDSFFASSHAFIRRMPDSQSDHELKTAHAKSIVIAPGYHPSPIRIDRQPGRPLQIGWVSRWEHDKRPDQFVHLVDQLSHAGVDFQLVLLGQRTGKEAALIDLVERYRNQISINQFAASGDEYRRALAQIDVVVSTAQHEFFGIGVCEAIDAGAAPVLPDRLSYPELVPNNDCYSTIQEAAEMLIRLTDPQRRAAAAETARRSIKRFDVRRCVAAIDAEIERLTEQRSC